METLVLVIFSFDRFPYHFKDFFNFVVILHFLTNDLIKSSTYIYLPNSFNFLLAQFLNR